MATNNGPTRTGRFSGEKYRAKRFEKVLGVVRHNRHQYGSTKERTVYMTAVANGPLTHREAENALQAACQNGRLIRWTGPEGVKRVTPTDDTERLRATATCAAQQFDPPRKDLIADANAAIAEVDG